jgi:uncharacterized protein YjbI with pentapeptide repeats
VKNPKEPLVKSLPERQWSEFENDGFSNALVKGNPVHKILISDLTIDSVIFEGVDFSFVDLEKVDFQNVLFRRCSLLNVDFSKRYVGRCRFEGCNLMGSKWIETGLYDVAYQDDNLDYANFSSSEMKVVSFTSCRLKESFFAESFFKDVAFESSDLTSAEIFKTSLGGIDLSSDTIDSLHCEADSLKGAIISPDQALDLITYFGLKIKSN